MKKNVIFVKLIFYNVKIKSVVYATHVAGGGEEPITNPKY